MHRNHAIGTAVCLGIHEIAQEVFEKVHTIKEAERQLYPKAPQGIIGKEFVAGRLAQKQRALDVHHMPTQAKVGVHRNGFSPDGRETVTLAAANFQIPVEQDRFVKVTKKINIMNTFCLWQHHISLINPINTTECYRRLRNFPVRHPPSREVSAHPKAVNPGQAKARVRQGPDGHYR
ncbi:hypothetical protein MXB90_14630 [Phaeovulum sp. NW3]|nr:hypothetical protein [Phaeovulum sp. NW3]MCL7466284.1 hypothetical protein [Phaeovulum sp. NW3]